MLRMKYTVLRGLTALTLISAACFGVRQEKPEKPVEEINPETSVVALPQYDVNNIFDIVGTVLGDFHEGLLYYKVNGEQIVEFRQMLEARETDMNLKSVDTLCTYSEAIPGDVECKSLQGYSSKRSSPLNILEVLNPESGLTRLFKYGTVYGLCYIKKCYLDADLDGKLDKEVDSIWGNYKIVDQRLLELRLRR